MSTPIYKITPEQFADPRQLPTPAWYFIPASAGWGNDEWARRTRAFKRLSVVVATHYSPDAPTAPDCDPTSAAAVKDSLTTEAAPQPVREDETASAAARNDALCAWARTYAWGHTDTGLADLTILVENFIQRDRARHYAAPLAELAIAKTNLADSQADRSILIDENAKLLERVVETRLESDSLATYGAQARAALESISKHGNGTCSLGYWSGRECAICATDFLATTPASVRDEIAALKAELKTQWKDCEHLLDCAFDGREFQAYSESLDAKLHKVTALKEEVSQLKAALELGQENCDAVYDDLREERDTARLQLAAASAQRDALTVQMGAWHASFGTSQLTHAIARLERAERDAQPKQE